MVASFYGGSASLFATRLILVDTMSFDCGLSLTGCTHGQVFSNIYDDTFTVKLSRSPTGHRSLRFASSLKNDSREDPIAYRLRYRYTADYGAG